MEQGSKEMKLQGRYPEYTVGREGERGEGGGGSKVMVGERTRGGREIRREGGREQGDGGRGNKGREGEEEGGRG